MKTECITYSGIAIDANTALVVHDPEYLVQFTNTAVINGLHNFATLDQVRNYVQEELNDSYRGINITFSTDRQEGGSIDIRAVLVCSIQHPLTTVIQ